MNKDNNDDESEQSQPSIRREYQGCRRGRANINFDLFQKIKKRNSCQNRRKSCFRRRKNYNIWRF